MPSSDIEMIKSNDTHPSDPPSTPLQPRKRLRNPSTSLSPNASSMLQKQSSREEGQAQSEHINDGEENDDDESTVQLSHTSSKMTLDLSTSSYSSIQSDMKQSGSPVMGNRLHPTPASTATPTTGDKETKKFQLTPRLDEVSLDTDIPLTIPRPITPTFHSRSDTPATLGGLKRAETPGEISISETDPDLSTAMSDTGDDQSQVAMYDFARGEEPSEYIAPVMPKVGGFGVETTKLKLQSDGKPYRTEDGEKREVSVRRITPSQTAESENWGANFWCIIEQPNGHSFFANPQTGECAWAVPSGTFVLPPRPEGQWWELYDENKKLPYYFHTKSKETQWEKPKGFVIPLASIQESTMGKRFSRSELKGALMGISGDAIEGKEKRVEEEIDEPSLQTKQPPPPSVEPHSNLYHARTVTPRRERTVPTPERRRLHGPPPLSASVAHRNRSVTGLSTIPSSTDLPSSSGMNGHGNSSDILSPPLAITRKMRSLSESWSPPGSPSFDLLSLSSTDTRKPYRRERDPAKRKQPVEVHQVTSLKGQDQTSKYGISAPTVFTRPRLHQQRSAPIFVNPRQSGFGTNGSTNSTKADGGSWTFEEYASKHFAIQRVGLLRRKNPISRLMSWQKGPIRQPLLPLESSELRKDAVRIFKVILRYFGDRENPVFWPKVPPSNFVGKTTNHDAGSDTNETSKLTTIGNGPALLEEVKWLLERGLVAPSLRDEIFAQVMKQMTSNDNINSRHRGLTLLCVLLSFFPPSKELTPYLSCFIRQRREETSPDNDDKVDLSTFCLLRLSQMANFIGHRSKGPTIADIQAAETAAYDPLVFGQSLEVIMSRQSKVYPDAAVPIVLQFLTAAMLSMGCLSTPGIFRIPGDADMVHDLQRRIDQGKYTLKGLIQPPTTTTAGSNNEINNDVSVLASTLKLWLRQLNVALFPEQMYNDCLKVSENSARIIELCMKLDTIHLRVVIYVVAFLQLFCNPSVISKTAMNVEALALIFAPSFLRSPSKDLEIVNNNVYYERKFVVNLLRHLPCDKLDSTFRPRFDVDATTWVETKSIITAKAEESNEKDWHLLPVQSQENHQNIGIGRDGINLTPRSRKSSMVKG